MKILIIEDEAELLTTAKKYLHAEGHVCEGASTFREGFERIIMYQYDCVVADIGLPDGNGIKLVEKLKSTSPDTGIIIISARNSLQDKVLGLDVGADDYLTKPFHLSELNARIKSILRRRKFHGSKEIVFNEIKVIPETFEAYVGSRSITLTKKELDLPPSLYRTRRGYSQRNQSRTSGGTISILTIRTISFTTTSATCARN